MLRSFRPLLAWSLSGVYGAVTKVETASPGVALTFDDGPDASVTPELLKLLDKHEARATFFVLGSSAEAAMGVLQEAVERGHELANHSWDHPCFLDIDASERRRQVEQTQAAIARAYGSRRPPARPLFRPPYGSQSLAIAKQMRGLGYTTVNWSLNSQDWHLTHPEHMRKRLERSIGSGDILLFHDGLYVAPHAAKGAQKPNPDRSAMLAALDSLLGSHREKFQFLTSSELLSRGRPARRP